MLVVNKVAITKFPAPSSLLFFQLFTTATCLIVLSKAGILEVEHQLSRYVLKSYCIVSIAFLGALYTNIKVLQYANIETFIVFRASTPILICLLDIIYLGRDTPTLRSMAALTCLLAGAIAYVLTDSQFEVTAYSWVLKWYIVFCIDQILIKHIVDSVQLSTWSRSLLTNSLACFPVLIAVFVSGEIEFVKKYSWSVESVAVILTSCVAGILMSLSSFLLRSLVSATYFTVIGTMCKILSVFVNYFMWDKHASGFGLCALAVCVLSALGYEQAGMRSVEHMQCGKKLSKTACAKSILVVVCVALWVFVSRYRLGKGKD